MVIELKENVMKSKGYCRRTLDGLVEIIIFIGKNSKLIVSISSVWELSFLPILLRVILQSSFRGCLRTSIFIVYYLQPFLPRF